jgi:hypothetical protein
MGFLSCPLPTDNVCDVPHRRDLGLNSIISYANRFTDTRKGVRRFSRRSHAQQTQRHDERSIALVELRHDEMLATYGILPAHPTKRREYSL